MDISTFSMHAHAQDREALESVRRAAREAYPGDVVFCGSIYAYVLERNIWGPGHPKRTNAPVRDDLHAVELITTNGTRWHGVDQM